ncbi:hypothetical protein ACQPYK_48530 (plasmid) [Streptosporangium sp. CA-135522]|uniref:hypothetical protein n=1 Tax=Streptosporangium sp. CA-135522 TaxID=3240072 RepID=UPI003D8A66A1
MATSPMVLPTTLVDLSGLTFIGSAGLAALLTIGHRLAAKGAIALDAARCRDRHGCCPSPVWPAVDLRPCGRSAAVTDHPARFLTIGRRPARPAAAMCLWNHLSATALGSRLR